MPNDRVAERGAERRGPAERAPSAARGVAGAPAPRVPDFVRPRRGARHTVDTALRTLRRLGVDAARVRVESDGPGFAPGTVLRQHPPAGTSLGPGQRVVLGVAGPGALEALPYAMRDGGEDDFGIDALMGLFDDPVHKLRHHLRAGGEFFALREGDLVVARRWIEQVFQVDPTRWAPARWPGLVRLLAAVHRTAGREDGLALALRLVHGLPLAGVRAVRDTVPVPRGEQLALGRTASRLGVDTLLGGRVIEIAALEATIGPVRLNAYLAHAGGALAAERRALYDLVLPAHLAARVRERWVVGDPAAPSRLGGGGPGPEARQTAGREAPPGVDPRQPAALGLTTRLAAAPAPTVPSAPNRAD